MRRRAARDLEHTLDPERDHQRIVALSGTGDMRAVPADLVALAAYKVASEAEVGPPPRPAGTTGAWT